MTFAEHFPLKQIGILILAILLLIEGFIIASEIERFDEKIQHGILIEQISK
jgi:hypothetical protein